MTISVKDLEPLDEVTKDRIDTELNFSLKLMALYFLFVFGIPILNFTAWNFMSIKVWGGMTLAWFLTAIVAELLSLTVASISIYCYSVEFFRNK